MAEQQLVEYIKKAKEAGQADQQTRTLLRQNGWTDSEINNAFSAAAPPGSEQPESSFKKETEPQPRDTQPQHQVSGQPEISVRKDFSQPTPDLTDSPREKPLPRQPEPKFEQAKPMRSEEASQPETPYAKTGPRVFLWLSVVFFLLAIIGVGVYFALAQGDLAQRLVNKTLSYFSPSVIITPSGEKTRENSGGGASLAAEKLTSSELFAVPAEYDAARISVAAFSKSGDKAAYCAPLKTNYTAFSCFLNDQKFIDAPYGKSPYWVGISPDSRRIAFLFFDTARKQSLLFENGVETRYDGTITFPKFSQDSQSLMFMVMANSGKNFIVVGGRQHPDHDKIFTPPDWSDDGNFIFYGARDGQDILWVADEIQNFSAQQPNAAE